MTIKTLNSMSMDNKRLIDLAAAEIDESVCVCVRGGEKQNGIATYRSEQERL